MCFFMFSVILTVTNSSFQEGMTFCRSINVNLKKVMKLLSFIFEQSLYNKDESHKARVSTQQSQ